MPVLDAPLVAPVRAFATNSHARAAFTPSGMQQLRGPVRQPGLPLGMTNA
jgi:hypothetical protein